MSETTETTGGETFKINGDWELQSKQLIETYSQLTEADLKLEPGKENELIRRIEVKLGKKREDVIELLKKGQVEKV